MRKWYYISGVVPEWGMDCQAASRSQIQAPLLGPYPTREVAFSKLDSFVKSLCRPN